MAVVLYTVQSSTWTNRMNVEAKFILPGLVKMQQVLEHNFAACRQRIKSPLHVASRVTVRLDGWSMTNLTASYLGICVWFYDLISAKIRNFVLQISQIQYLIQQLCSCCRIEWEIFANRVLMTVSDNGLHHWRTQRGEGEGLGGSTAPFNLHKFFWIVCLQNIPSRLCSCAH